MEMQVSALSANEDDQRSTRSLQLETLAALGFISQSEAETGRLDSTLIPRSCSCNPRRWWLDAVWLLRTFRCLHPCPALHLWAEPSMFRHTTAPHIRPRDLAPRLAVCHIYAYLEIDPL